ncbi:MAG: hypothetical protein ACXVI3_06455 [Halobacteriota archaeon]
MTSVRPETALPKSVPTSEEAVCIFLPLFDYVIFRSATVCVGLSVVVRRRTGATQVLDAFRHFLLIGGKVALGVPAVGMGRDFEDVGKYKESIAGLQTLPHL